MNAEFISKFLTNTDDTGRFIVVSQRTGRKYFVEPVGNPRTDWGSIDPASGKLMNKSGFQKYRGSVDEKDSLVTMENGFSKVHNLGPGVSPFHAIEVIDAKYPDKA